MRHLTSALQGNEVDEPEALEGAVRHSRGMTPMDPCVHAQAVSMFSPTSLQGQRQTSMEHGELQRIALIMIVYGELLLYECQSSVDLLTYGFIGSLALADEQPRECAQRVVGDALSHRSQSEVNRARLWLEGASSRRCYVE